MGRRRTLADRIKDNKALMMKCDGVQYDRIASQGWDDDVPAVKRAIQRALADNAIEDADTIRMIQLARLDDVMRMTLKIAVTEHYHVSATGHVAEHPVTGELLLDPGPNLQALNTLVKINESTRKLLGVDAPAKHSITIDAVDAEIRELESLIAQQRPVTRKAIAP